jgi:hypothetical protein
MVPLSRFPVQTAKRAWLLLNLGFLAGTFWLLARVTQFSFAQVALVAFVGHGALASNFLLGQYYVFLLPRRTFVMEPELNPHPMWNMPEAFFPLGPLVTLTLLALPLMAPARRIINVTSPGFS